MYPRKVLTAFSLTALAATALLPLLVERPPAAFLPPRDGPWPWAAKLLVTGILLLVVAGRWYLDRRLHEAGGPSMLTFLAAAAAMTACHWLMVDSQTLPNETVESWQRDLYLGTLNHTYDPPHRYRPLPYGFVRLLEWVTHDWSFSCLAYRFFFNYWLLWAWHRFACLFHAPRRAALTLLPFLLYYPLSIALYRGQLTDPLSHTLFVLGFLYIFEDRPLALAAALALGIVAKETAVLLVPCWLVCHLRGGWRAWITTAALGAAATAAFLAARLSFGWQPGAKEMNGAGLMIGTNLGLGEPGAYTGVPLIVNYLHPLLFVAPFVPPIAWQWRRIDVRLRLVAATLTPLLLVSNLCFGWLYESRNYVPLLPLFTTMALPVRRPSSTRAQLLPQMRSGPDEQAEGKSGGVRAVGDRSQHSRQAGGVPADHDGNG
jgi:hypothetical protein